METRGGGDAAVGGAQAGKSLGVTSTDRAAHVLRALGMCAYFGFDHVVWATQAGVVADESETLGEYAQKVSYWGWFVGSASGLFLNTAELNALLDAMREKGFARPEGVDAEVDADAEGDERGGARATRRGERGDSTAREKSFRRSDHEQRADGVGDGALRTGEDVQA